MILRDIHKFSEMKMFSLYFVELYSTRAVEQKPNIQNCYIMEQTLTREVEVGIFRLIM